MIPFAIIVVSFFIGAIPFSNLVAHRVADVDLRQVDTGTVSGTSLYRTAGLTPLLIGGILDVCKAMPGPLLAHDRPVIAALAGGAAVIGHNWSPYLNWAGGRGISPALGALVVTVPGATLILLGGLALGRILHHTGLITFITVLGLPVLAIPLGGGLAALAAACVGLPMLVKRLTGNTPLPPSHRTHTLAHRLLFDNDG